MRSRVVLAALADAACVLAFAAAGRASHAEAGALVDVLRIAWPFLAGGALAWVVTRAWRAPLRVWPQGVGIWALTWAFGMLLRGLAGDGRAPAFLLVAAVVLAALLIGWRGIAALVSATRRAAGSQHEAPRSGAAGRPVPRR